MAKLLDGTRIYGTANVDNQIWVGTNGSINTTAFSIIGNTTTSATMQLFGDSLLIGNGSITDQSYIAIANSQGNTTINTTSINTSWGLITNTSGLYHTGVINSFSYNTGSLYGSSTGGAIVNTTYVAVGNTSVNTVITYGSITGGNWLVANTSGLYHTGTMNAATVSIGTNFVANTSGLYHTGTMNAATVSIGTNFVANALGVYHTGTMNAATVSIGTNFVANTTQVTIAGGILLSANGSLGTNGYYLVANSTGAPFWSNIPPTSRVLTQTSASSITLNWFLYDMYVFTALAGTLTFNLSGTPTPANGRKVIIRIKDNGTAQTLTWTTTGSGSFRSIGTTLPSATTVNKVTYVGCVYNSDESYWDVIAVGTQT